MRLPVALALALAAALAGAACGRSDPRVSAFDCVLFQAQELNATTHDCLGPPVVTEGLSVCHDPAEAQGHGIIPVCVVSSDGRVFRGNVTSTQWLEGAGWTHSNFTDQGDTLSAADEARCAPALAGVPACP